jgi:hypothetical protein
MAGLVIGAAVAAALIAQARAIVESAKNLLGTLIISSIAELFGFFHTNRETLTIMAR